jgi:CPA2 family monovalent cation:H+ antiporter-2
MDTYSIHLLTTLFLVFGAAIVGGLLAKRANQPPLLGYITAGVVFGSLLPRLADQEFLRLIADAGVTLLLFALGVEFSFHRLRGILRAVFWAALVQILVTATVFFFGFLFFNFSFLASLFIGIAVSLSSTAVVVKVLSDRGELDTLPGQVMTGWLVVQDLAVVPIMILLPAIVRVVSVGDTSVLSALGVIGASILKSAVAIFLIMLLGKRVIPKVLGKIAAAGSREIFVLFTVGLVLLSAVTTYALGLSAALGAFIAGLLVAETTQNHAIFAEIRPLRDLFAVVFFVSLGLALPGAFFLRYWALLLGATAAVIVVKWFVVLGLARFLGYHRKTAFLVAVGLTQMSEFGFIIAKEGMAKGALAADEYTLLVGMTFLTILVSAPLLAQGHGLYYWVHKTLGRWWPTIFRSKAEIASLESELPIKDHIVLCGYGRVGRYIGRALQMADIPFLVVDYNSATVAELKGKGMQVVYGDPADKDVLDYAQVDRAKAVVIAIPDRHTQQMVIANAQSLNRRVRIICRTHHEEDQKDLRSMGVGLVIQPEFEAALTIVERLFADFGVAQEEIPGKVSRLKLEHGMG